MRNENQSFIGDEDVQIWGRIIMRIEDYFCSRIFLSILLQNVRNQTFICEHFEDGPPLFV